MLAGGTNFWAFSDPAEIDCSVTAGFGGKAGSSCPAHTIWVKTPFFSPLQIISFISSHWSPDILLKTEDLPLSSTHGRLTQTAQSFINLN
jgi:hypothetical protein